MRSDNKEESMKKIALGLALFAMMASGCTALGIGTKVEDTRQAALKQFEKAACANIQETKTFVKGSKLESVDWAAICGK